MTKSAASRSPVGRSSHLVKGVPESGTRRGLDVSVTSGPSLAESQIGAVCDGNVGAPVTGVGLYNQTRV